MGTGTVARCNVMEARKASSEDSVGRGSMDWKSVFSAYQGTQKNFKTFSVDMR